MINSKLFTFVIGENKKPIVCRSGLLASISRPLDALMNGSMSEAQSNTAVIADMTEDEFVRIYQFACTGDYSSPSLLEVGTENKALRQSRIGYGMDSEWERSNYDSRDPTAREELRRDFHRVYMWDVSEGHPGGHRSCPDVYADDFAVVADVHLRIYELADKYAMAHLMQLSIKKMHCSLITCPVDDSTVRKDILSVVRHVYDITPSSSSNGADTMRTMLVHYIACEIDSFSKDANFLAMFDEIGDFKSDMWYIFQERLFV